MKINKVVTVEVKYIIEGSDCYFNTIEEAEEMLLCLEEAVREKGVLCE